MLQGFSENRLKLYWTYNGHLEPGITYRYLFSSPQSFLSRLVTLLHLFDGVSMSFQGYIINRAVPWDEPSHANAWLTGLSVWSIKLFTISSHQDMSVWLPCTVNDTVSQDFVVSSSIHLLSVGMCGTQKTSFDIYQSYLAVQNGFFRAQLIDDLTFNFVNFLEVLNSLHRYQSIQYIPLLCPSPWRGYDPWDWLRDWLKGSNWFAVLGKISVQLYGTCKSFLKECLMETIVLVK